MSHLKFEKLNATIVVIFNKFTTAKMDCMDYDIENPKYCVDCETEIPTHSPNPCVICNERRNKISMC